MKASAIRPAGSRDMTSFALEWRRRWRLRRTSEGPLHDYLSTPLPRPSRDYRELEYVAVDLETTGLDARRDQILSIGWVLLTGALLAVTLAAEAQPLPEPREWDGDATMEEIRAWVAGRRVPLVAHPAAFRERWGLGEEGEKWGPRLVPLAGWQAAGAEIVLHGLTHRAPGAPPPGLVNALMHRWFSRGCDEFAHLSAREEPSAQMAWGRDQRCSVAW